MDAASPTSQQIESGSLPPLLRYLNSLVNLFGEIPGGNGPLENVRHLPILATASCTPCGRMSGPRHSVSELRSRFSRKVSRLCRPVNLNSRSSDAYSKAFASLLRKRL